MNRSNAREEAFKQLFQIDLHETIDINEVKGFTKQIVTGVLDQKDTIDQQIKNHLINWSFDRIAMVDKTILRIATYEILFMDDIPNAVSINEAVELAHKYGDDHSSKFINGVLSQIMQKGETNGDR